MQYFLNLGGENMDVSNCTFQSNGNISFLSFKQKNMRVGEFVTYIYCPKLPSKLFYHHRSTISVGLNSMTTLSTTALSFFQVWGCQTKISDLHFSANQFLKIFLIQNTQKKKQWSRPFLIYNEEHMLLNTYVTEGKQRKLPNDLDN